MERVWWWSEHAGIWFLIFFFFFFLAASSDFPFDPGPRSSFPTYKTSSSRKGCVSLWRTVRGSPAEIHRFFATAPCNMLPMRLVVDVPSVLYREQSTIQAVSVRNAAFPTPRTANYETVAALCGARVGALEALRTALCPEVSQLSFEPDMSRGIGSAATERAKLRPPLPVEAGRIRRLFQQAEERASRNAPSVAAWSQKVMIFGRSHFQLTCCV